MNETTVTLTGFVATAPRHVVSGTGTAFTSFRMASTRRFLDRAKEAWVDGPTLWVTVKVWRDAANHVAESLHKGDPVVAVGTLGVDEWDSAEGPRSSLTLEARAVGPDVTRGVARFARVVREVPLTAAQSALGAADEVDGGVDGGLDADGADGADGAEAADGASDDERELVGAATSGGVTA